MGESFQPLLDNDRNGIVTEVSEQESCNAKQSHLYCGVLIWRNLSTLKGFTGFEALHLVEQNNMEITAEKKRKEVSLEQKLF